MSRKLAMVLAVGFAVAAVDAVIVDAHAGTCRKDAREIRLRKDSVIRLSDYRCRSDRDAQAQIRVQFQRLTGLVPGALLNGGSSPWSAILYGAHPRILSNATLTEYKDMLTRFGAAVKEKDGGGGENIAISLHVIRPSQSAAADDNNEDFANAGRGAEIRSFRLPDLPQIPLMDETVAILTKPAWPDSLNMYYSNSMIGGEPSKSPLDAMTVWRYLTRNDLQEYSQRVERYNALVSDRKYYALKRVPKAVALLEYLTAGGWPETFLYSWADISSQEGCLPLDFKNEEYSIGVDVAVIENVSTKAINIDQLLGRSGGGNQLRQRASGSAQPDEDVLQAQPVTLAPAERLIVPMAIVLVATRPTTSEDDKQISQKQFQKVTSSKPGTVFQTRVYSSLRGVSAGEDLYVIRKVRESFKAPSYPTQTDFAFGPEWSLAGLVLGGDKILFEAAAPNFLEMTAGAEIGSCPILYAWNGSEATWVRRGKIIHQARTWSNRSSETISFDGFVGRFRIAEEELERATISDVRLTVELADGGSLTLAPDVGPPSADKSVELYANDEVEFNFALPENLRESDVTRSRLTVSGYYDRYPALILGRIR